MPSCLHDLKSDLGTELSLGILFKTSSNTVLCSFEIQKNMILIVSELETWWKMDNNEGR